MSKTAYIEILVEKGPGPDCGIVEVENDMRHSINAGEWYQRGDGYWVLRIYPTVFE